MLSSKLVQNNEAGRPKKDYDECKERTKRKFIKDSSENISLEESCEQLKKKFKSEHNGPAAKILEVIVKPEAAESLYHDYLKPSMNEMSAEDALGLLIQTNISKDSYQLLRNNAKALRHKLYPPYYKVA